MGEIIKAEKYLKENGCVIINGNSIISINKPEEFSKESKERLVFLYCFGYKHYLVGMEEVEKFLIIREKELKRLTKKLEKWNRKYIKFCKQKDERAYVIPVIARVVYYNKEIEKIETEIQDLNNMLIAIKKKRQKT